MSYLLEINPNIKMPHYDLVLCKLTGEEIMTVVNIVDFQLQARYGSVAEISFKIPLYRTDNEGKKKRNERYDAVNGDMLLKVNEDDIFYINSAKETSNDGEVYKEVHAYSREYELSQKMIMGYKATSRKLCTLDDIADEDKDSENYGYHLGFLNFIESITGWKADRNAIPKKFNNMYRAIEFSNTNVLAALQEVQKIFNCIFVFDTKNKIIKVHTVNDSNIIDKNDRETYEADNGFFISDKNFLKSISKNINSDEIKTRLFLYGQDNQSIQTINPTGLPYIENYDYYKKTEFMTQDLIDALNSYEDFVHKLTTDNDYVQNTYHSSEIKYCYEFYIELLTGKTSHLDENGDVIYNPNFAIKELDEAEIRLQRYKKEVEREELLLDVIIAKPHVNKDAKNDDNKEKISYEDWDKEVKAQQAKIANLKNELKRAQDSRDKSYNEVQKLKDTIQKFKFFIQKKRDELFNTGQKFNPDKPDLNYELDPFIKEEIFMDSNYNENTLNELLDEGKKKLFKISQPAIKFEATVVDFLDVIECQHVWSKFVLGDVVYLKQKDIGFDYRVRLVGYTHRPQAHDLKLQFSSIGSVDDPTIYLSDLLSEMRTTSSDVDFNRFKWDKGLEADTVIKQYINSNFDLAKQALVSADNQNVTIDNRGYWGTTIDTTAQGVPKIAKEQIRITNNLIAMTKDDWKTLDVAISPTMGVNASLLNGEIGNFCTVNADRLQAGIIRSVPETDKRDINGNIMYDSSGKPLREPRTWINLDSGEFMFRNTSNTLLFNAQTGIRLFDDNNRPRIILGKYEKDNRVRYGLVVKDEANRNTIIDEDGILQCWQEGRCDNVDENNGLKINIFIPENTRHIYSAILRVQRELFRTYSKNAESETINLTSTGGGGSVNETGQAIKDREDRKPKSGDSTLRSVTSHVTEWEDPRYSRHGGHNHGIDDGTPLMIQGGGTVKWVASGNHTHDITIEDHQHYTNIDHRHQIILEEHHHGITMPSHGHPVRPLIYKTGGYPTYRIYINGSDVSYNVMGSSSSSFDKSNINITRYLNKGRWNTIEIRSDRLGRIDASVFVQCLLNYNGLDDNR